MEPLDMKKQLESKIDTRLRRAKNGDSVEKSMNDLGIETVQAGNFKVPIGHRLVNKDKPHLGLEPVPGFKSRTKLTPEQAGRMTQILTARRAFDSVKSLLRTKDGSLDNINILNANLNLPKTEGRRLRVGLEQVIQAITRIETGAAMPPEEVENTRKRFMPTPLDDEETVELKLDLIEAFMNGGIKLVAPDGKLDTEAFDREVATRRVSKRIAPGADETTLRQQAEAAIAAGAPADLVNKALEDALARGK